MKNKPQFVPRPDTSNGIEPPYEMLKKPEYAIELLTDLGCTVTGTDDLGTLLRHPESKGNGFHVFDDTGIIHCFTNRLGTIDSFEPREDYTVPQFIIEVMGQDPMVLGREKRWLAPAKVPKVSRKKVLRKTMPQVMSDNRGKADELPIFGNFIYQKYITMLYAEAGTGKSVMAFQIAETISTGGTMEPFAPADMPRGVLYFNYELTEMGVLSRYRQDGVEKQFNNNFQIISKDGMGDLFTTDRVAQEIAEAKKSDPDLGLVVIDNLSYLIAYSKELGDVATFLQAMSDIAVMHTVAMLIINHTTKGTSDHKMKQDNMQGSKAYSNYSDYLIELKTGKNSTEILCKETKTRNAKKLYEGDNIPLFILSADPFLELRFDRYTTEDAEQPGSLSDRTKRAEIQAENAKNMMALDVPQTLIAKYLNVTRQTVYNWLNSNIPKPEK